MHKKIDIHDMDLNGDYNNRQICGKLAGYLLARTSIDDLIQDKFKDDEWVKCSAGCGNAEFYLSFPTRSHALVSLASSFMGYSLDHYGSCYIGAEDYYLLKEFTENEYFKDQRYKQAFDDFLHQFCVIYSEIDNSFLLEIIKR